ncbi:extracellular solute-binding protein, partial [bacterium]|nr:extracellular solute-binding protein [bacterium]
MVKESAPDVYKKSAVSPQLVGTNGKYDVALMNLVIPKKAKNKDLALEFAIQLTNKENQLKLSKLTGVLPVNKYALDDDYFKIAKSTEPIERARIIGAEQLNNLIQNDFGYDNKKSINDIINKTLENSLVLDKNIKNEIKILANEIDKLKGNK